jgi:DNA-binding NtrC family response regulator
LFNIEKKRVLVAESDAIILGLITYILRRQGLDVVSVSNTSDALVQLAASSFDAIVLEPAGSDLLEVLHQLHPLLAERVIVVTTGKEVPTSRPVHAVLRKPFEVAELARTVNQVLLLRSGGGSAHHREVAQPLDQEG